MPCIVIYELGGKNRRRALNAVLEIGPMELLIAGTALSRNAVLVSDNTREFSRVTGLRLVNWRIDGN